MINRPNRSKPLLVIIALLLLVNLGGLAYFLANKPAKKVNNTPPWKNAIANYLKTDIGFDTVQLERYEQLKTEHRKKLDSLSDQLKAEKENRLSFLARNGYSDSAINQSASSSAEKQKMLDLQMLTHLKDIRNICNAEQRNKFDTSIYKIMTRKGGDKRKPKKTQ